MRKLSGLMSLWMKLLLCMYSILEMSWSASRSTVFRLNLREQKLKRSSKLGPNSSMTITLKSPSGVEYENSVRDCLSVVNGLTYLIRTT
jgi:hypothetical protein